MAVKLADKIAETKTVTVTWGEDDVDVSYFPNAVTAKLLSDIDQAADAEDLTVIGVALEPILDWWDVLDDKGKRIPTDRDTIASLPLAWIIAVQSALEEAQNPPENGS